MKRRWFSILAALALCLGLLPGTARALDLPGLLIQDTMVTSENMSDVLGNGTVSTTYENGKWTIHLTNAALSGPISVNHTSSTEAVDAEIILSGTNTVTVNRDSASGISASANLTISGEGTLAVTSTGANAAGIGVAGRLAISGAEVSATAKYTAIYGDTVKLQGSRVTASSSTSNALYGNTGIEISGSTVSAEAENEDVLNDVYCPAVVTRGKIIISGSTVSANSEQSEGINSTDGIQISNKSSVTGESLSYALYSPKTISISDSTVEMTSNNHTAIHSAEGIQITKGAEVTLQGCEGCLVVQDVEDGTKTGTLLIDGAKLRATAVCGPGVFVNGQATIQNKAEVTAITKEHSGSNSPGYGLYALGLAVDGSTLSAAALGTGNKTQGGIYVGTRDENNPAGDMTVEGDSTVTASGKNNCGITVEGTLSVEGGNVTSQSTADHGINVGETLLILKGSVDFTSEGYRGANIGKLLDIRNGAAFHAKSTSSYKDVAVAVKKADGIQLGSLCVEETGGTPGAAQIAGSAATVFVDENGGGLQEVTITTDSADYTEVNAAISQIPEDLSVYTSESVAALNSAKNAVNWELPGAQQDTVDGYAAAIEAAIAGLVRRPVDPDPPVDPGQIETEVRVEEGISQVPEGLQSTYQTPEALESAMRVKVTAAAGVSAENTAVYDVALLVSTDGGTTWTKATAENFPAGGLTVTLPYPEGTDSSYTFTVVHMFTTSDFGMTPGNTETPAVTNTEAGLRFTVTGLSPISVGWTAPKPDRPTTPDRPADSSRPSGGGSAGTYAVTVEKAEHGKVSSSRTSASGGSTVTLTVTPEEGYVLDTLTVTDSRGNAVELTEKSGRYTFTMPERAVTVRAVFAPLPEETKQPCDGGAECPSRSFADLEQGAWYHEAVDFVLERGLMGGHGNGLFGPNDTLTRAQFAQILYHQAGRPAAAGTAPFTDVTPDAWYAPAVAWAAEQGVVGGYGGGLFGPEDPITREQLAVMLWRYAGSPAAPDGELAFTDAEQVGAYAREALVWAVQSGVMSGKGGGVLEPKGLATRAQAASMLRNFLENG